MASQELPQTNADITPHAIVLHLVCGASSQGGMMSYVRQLVSHPMPGFDQCVWKHRSYQPENASFVCRGRARNTDITIVQDFFGSLFDFLPLYFWLRQNKNVIIHAHSRIGAILSVLIRVFRSIPVVVHVHTIGKHCWFHHALWRLARARVIFNSPRTCQAMGCSIEKSEIMMPTIQWPAPPPTEGTKFVASSVFVALKKLDLILAAFTLVSKNIPVCLDIYGLSPTPFEPVFQEHIVALSNGNPRIHLHAWDEQWTDQLRRDDIFIHAADRESFGIVVLEAFAKGCRLVVPSGMFLDNLPEPCRSEGIWRAELTAEDMAAKLKLAFQSPVSDNLWELRKSVADQFDVKNTLIRLSAIYRECSKGFCETVK